MSAALEVANVEVLPSTPPMQALDGVSLRIDEGELVAIVRRQDPASRRCCTSSARSTVRRGAVSVAG